MSGYKHAKPSLVDFKPKPLAPTPLHHKPASADASNPQPHGASSRSIRSSLAALFRRVRPSLYQPFPGSSPAHTPLANHTARILPFPAARC